MVERKERLLIPLTCPECGGDLDGGNSARIYLCRECSYALFMERPGEKYPVRYVQAHVKTASQRVYVPFWRVTGTFKASGANKKQSIGYGRIRSLGPLYFPAFWSPRLGYFDNLTLTYSKEEAKMAFEEGRDDAILDGIRDPAILAEMARLTWLGYLDRFSDVTGLEGRYEVKDILYAGVPFFPDGDHFLDGVSGVRIPKGFLPPG